MFRMFNVDWYSNYIQDELTKYAKYNPQDEILRDEVEKICRMFAFLFTYNNALGGRLKIDYIRNGIPTESLIESDRRVEEEIKKREPFYDIAHPNMWGYQTEEKVKKGEVSGLVQRISERAKKFNQMSPKEQLQEFKKDINNFAINMNNLMRISFYVPIDYKDTLEEKLYLSEVKKFFEQEWSEELFKKFLDWKYRYRNTFLVNAELELHRFIKQITWVAYNKEKKQLTIPEQRAFKLLFFPRLGGYTIPILTKKMIGFLNYKPPHPENLLRALILDVFKNNKAEKERLNKALSKLWREYLNTQYGEDLIKDAFAFTDYLGKSRRQVKRKIERERYGSIGRKKKEIEQRKKEEAFRLKGKYVLYKKERRTGKYNSLQEQAGKEKDDFTLEDTVSGDVVFFEQIKKDEARQFTQYWIDYYCFKKLKEVARLKYIDDLELNAIAKQINKSESYVDKQIAQIKKELLKYLNKHKQGEYIAELLNLKKT